MTTVCSKCGVNHGATVRGVCLKCRPNPFLACPKCYEGTLKSNSLPNWMNRWVCDKCGKEVSR